MKSSTGGSNAAAKLPTGARLFPFTHQQFCRAFRAGAEKAQVAQLEAIPYSLRHAGPSHDKLSRKRTIADIKKRGRWRTNQSVRRYENSGNVLKQISKINPEVVASIRRQAVTLGDRLAKLL